MTFLSLAMQTTMATANRKSESRVILRHSPGLCGIVLALLVSGCTPYQRLRDQWSTMAHQSAQTGLPIHPTAGATNGANPVGAAPAQVAADSTGPSEHGEEITPLAVDRSQTTANIPDDSKTPIQAKIEPIPKDLLEEFLPSAAERSRGIDDRMAPLSKGMNESATPSLTAQSEPSVANAAAADARPASESSIPATPTGASVASAPKQGPPAPPWQRHASRQSAIQGFTQSVAARAAQATSASEANLNASATASDTVTQSGHNEASSTASTAGNETFDPFEGTDFELPASTPASITASKTAGLPPRIHDSQVMAASAVESVAAKRDVTAPATPTSSMKTEPVAMKNAARAAAQSTAQAAQKAAQATASVARSPSPASSAKRPASKNNASPVAASVTNEFSASLGETLLSQASLSPAPSIAPLQLVANGPPSNDPPAHATSTGTKSTKSRETSEPPASMPIQRPVSARPASFTTSAAQRTSDTKSSPSPTTVPSPTTTTSPPNTSAAPVASDEPTSEPSKEASAAKEPEPANDGWQAVPVEPAADWKGKK